MFVLHVGLPYGMMDFAQEAGRAGRQGELVDAVVLVEEGEVDGFNLSRLVVPESYADFIDLVIPELQDRGLYKTAYGEGSLRRKLFGAHDLLPVRVEAVLAPGQSVVLSTPRGVGQAPESVEIGRRADALLVRKATAAATN